MDNRDKCEIVVAGNYRGNLRGIFEILYSHTTYRDKIIFLCTNFEDFEYLTTVNLPTAYWTLEPGHQHTWRMLQRAKVIIGDDINFVNHEHTIFKSLTKNSQKLNLWHGSPLKDIGEKSLLRHSVYSGYSAFESFLDNEDYFLVPEQSDLEKYRNVLPKAKLFVGPEPKWTLFLKDLENIDSSDNKDAKVLYAPTYREENVWPNELASTLIKAFKKEDFDLVIKPHPHDSKLIKQLEISLIPFLGRSTEIYKVIASSDAVITDYSSLGIELARIDFPIALFQFDSDYYFDRHGAIDSVVEKNIFNSIEDIPAMASNLKIQIEEKRKLKVESLENIERYWIDKIQEILQK